MLVAAASFALGLDVRLDAAHPAVSSRAAAPAINMAVSTPPATLAPNVRRHRGATKAERADSGVVGSTLTDCQAARAQLAEPRLLFLLRPGINVDESIAVRSLSIAGFHVGVYQLDATRDYSDGSFYADNSSASGWLPNLHHVRHIRLESSFIAAGGRADDANATLRLLRAVSEWKPVLVLPDSRSTTLLLQHAATVMLRGEGGGEGQGEKGLGEVRTSDIQLIAARQLCRCSLPDPKFFFNRGSKSGIMELARSLGVDVPRSVQIVLDVQAPLSTLTHHVSSQISQSGLRLPVVLKTDADGGGSGVHLCGGRMSLGACLKTFIRPRGKARITVQAQEFLRGVTTACVASALHGVVLAGHCVIKQVTAERPREYKSRAGKLGACHSHEQELLHHHNESTTPSVVVRTFNDDVAFAWLATLIRATSHTGVVAADFRVSSDSRAPRSVLIDYNARMSFFSTLSPRVLGQQTGVLEALHRALLPPHDQRNESTTANVQIREPVGSTITNARIAARATEAEAARLPRSVALAKFRPYEWAWRGCLPSWLFCTDVAVEVPWEDVPLMRALNTSGLRFCTATRTFWHTTDPHRRVASRSAPNWTWPALVAAEGTTQDEAAWLKGHACAK